mmetsp:Transcript_14093/g.44347  ORF Transcript_14093/g.44347 Transcript_14093/m.44347 type:complete len:235 (-) Transcript_14093:1836-2540(-)
MHATLSRSSASAPPASLRCSSWNCRTSTCCPNLTCWKGWVQRRARLTFGSSSRLATSPRCRRPSGPRKGRAPTFTLPSPTCLTHLALSRSCRCRSSPSRSCTPWCPRWTRRLATFTRTSTSSRCQTCSSRQPRRRTAFRPTARSTLPNCWARRPFRCQTRSRTTSWPWTRGWGSSGRSACAVCAPSFWRSRCAAAAVASRSTVALPASLLGGRTGTRRNAQEARANTCASLALE